MTNKRKPHDYGNNGAEPKQFSRPSRLGERKGCDQHKSGQSREADCEAVTRSPGPRVGPEPRDGANEGPGPREDGVIPYAPPRAPNCSLECLVSM